MGNLSIQFGFAACPKNMSLAEGGQMLKYPHNTHHGVLSANLLGFYRQCSGLPYSAIAAGACWPEDWR
jgi:hypothetical protein